MKLLIISDIHGDSAALAQALSRFDQEQAEHLVILGDVLNHGPRNLVPAAYDPQAVVELLNPLAERITAVRGNCDSEVDQMLLSFPCLADYSQIWLGSQRLFLTHGHQFGPQDHPRLTPDTLLCSGHTHVPTASWRDGIGYFNPGSIAMPREQWQPSYGVISQGSAEVRALDGGEVLLAMRLPASL